MAEPIEQFPTPAPFVPPSAPAPVAAPPMPPAPIEPAPVLAQPAAPAPPAQPTVFEDSPFGDFLPAWLTPQPQATPKPSAAAAANSWPKAPAPAGTGSLSIDALTQPSLNGHQSATPAPVSTLAPGPQAAIYNPAGPVTPPVDPTGGLPVPGFQLPPLWFKQPEEAPWQEVRAAERPRAVPSNSITEGYNPSLAGPQTRPEKAEPEPQGPEYGIDRGFYFFTDRAGNVVLHALAGFGRRLAAAFVDSIISGILGIIFFYLVVVLFLNLNNGDYMQSILGVTLALVILPVLFGFLYHTVLVGLTGQTLGDRLLKIKVIRRGGRAVGLVSGVVRALYGLVPSLVSSIIQFVLAPNATSRDPLPLLIGATITGLTALGMAWALIDKGHQGLHDKLADTYVVSARES